MRHGGNLFSESRRQRWQAISRTAEPSEASGDADCSMWAASQARSSAMARLGADKWGLSFQLSANAATLLKSMAWHGESGVSADVDMVA